MRGRLQALFRIETAGLISGLSLQIDFKQNTKSDTFFFQVSNAQGEFTTLFSTHGKLGFASYSAKIPASATVNGAVNVRIVSSRDANNCVLDKMVIADGDTSAPTDQSGTATPTPSPAPAPTPLPSPMPPVAAPAPSALGVLLPPVGMISWDWQIGASTDAAIVAPIGAKMIDVDGFTTSAAKVAQLKAQGLYTVCYIDAGSWEPGRPDSDQYPSYLKIYFDKDWNEWFLDVKDVFKPNSVLAAILRNRVEMCKDKGFDALEPDNLQNDENAGGLVTTQQQLNFNSWIADLAHEYGLAVFQKNGPDKVLLKDSTGKMMVEKFDAILNEECQAYNECGPLAEYVKRGKLAVNVEYKGTLNCSKYEALGISAIRKDLNLVGAGNKGYVLQTCP